MHDRFDLPGLRGVAWRENERTNENETDLIDCARQVEHCKARLLCQLHHCIARRRDRPQRTFELVELQAEANVVVVLALDDDVAQ